MRLKSALWVAAYLRRCNSEAIPAVVRRKGAEEAGAIFVVVDRLDGTVDLYGPAPQGAWGEMEAGERAFVPALGANPVGAPEAHDYLQRQLRFDPDIWVVDTEERAGRHFLDLAKSA